MTQDDYENLLKLQCGSCHYIRKEVTESELTGAVNGSVCYCRQRDITVQDIDPACLKHSEIMYYDGYGKTDYQEAINAAGACMPPTGGVTEQQMEAIAKGVTGRILENVFTKFEEAVAVFIKREIQSLERRITGGK